jgi:hypothetical protein
MKRLVMGVALLALGSAASSAEDRRELGAHEHGHSVLNIAIEGDLVEMELISPGADIVGFEHAANTDEQKAALEQADAALRDPLALFVLPAEAGCALGVATVELETEHAEDHEDEHEQGEHAEHEDGEEGHAEFHAGYVIRCQSPDHLASIGFAFFERFPAAEEIEVTVITETGQTRYEVERDAPRIDLRGVI